jgi:hypothetical protein
LIDHPVRADPRVWNGGAGVSALRRRFMPIQNIFSPLWAEYYFVLV